MKGICIRMQLIANLIDLSTKMFASRTFSLSLDDNPGEPTTCSERDRNGFACLLPPLRRDVLHEEHGGASHTPIHLPQECIVAEQIISLTVPHIDGDDLDPGLPD